MKGILCLALVAICLALIPALAAASNSVPTVSITSPEEGLTIATRMVTVEAAFTAPQDATIELAELVVDGVTIDARKIDPALAEGTVSFTWLARDYANGTHRIVVRAIDSDGQVAKAQIAVVLRAAPSIRDTGVRITSPAEGQTVSGNTTVTVEVDNPALAKYVIFLVDDVLKAVSNVRPFTYAWDTTRYLNGVHVLKVQAYAGGTGEAVSAPMQVRVDNPSGATAIREPKMSMSPVAPTPTAPPSRSSETTLPPPVRSESLTPAYPEVPMPTPALAVPGTAPFISPSGELVTPPTPEPVEIAALPTFAQSPVSPSLPVGPARAPALPSLAVAVPEVGVPAATLTPAEPSVAAVAVTESAASAGREPVQAPFQIAMLPTPEAPRPAEASPAPEASATEPAPVAEVPIPAALPPAEHSAEVTEVAAVPAAETQVVAAPQPAASEVRVAMLPPRPVEAIPAPKVSAEPAQAQIEYVVRVTSSLDRLAAELGVPATEIARANNLGGQSSVHPGQRLSIPSAPITFDGRPVKLDAPAVVADGRAIVPFRSMIEQAGGKVSWDSTERLARASAGGHEIAVVIGSDHAQVDGRAVAMASAAQIRCDRTVVPLRFLGDALDLALQYEDGIIHIASAK